MPLELALFVLDHGNLHWAICVLFDQSIGFLHPLGAIHSVLIASLPLQGADLLLKLEQLIVPLEMLGLSYR